MWIWYDFNAHLPQRPNAIAHVWRSEINVSRIVKAGHRVIHSSEWYLDHIKGGEDWSYMYAFRPRALRDLTPTEQQLIIGGEACMWGEFVDDTNLENSVW